MAGLAPTSDVLANHLSFLQMDLVDPEFHRHALALAREMLLFLHETLDEAVAKGELTPCDTTRLARAVQAIVGGSLMFNGPLIARASFESDFERTSKRCCGRAILGVPSAVTTGAGADTSDEGEQILLPRAASICTRHGPATRY